MCKGEGREKETELVLIILASEHPCRLNHRIQTSSMLADVIFNAQGMRPGNRSNTLLLKLQSQCTQNTEGVFNRKS